MKVTMEQGIEIQQLLNKIKNEEVSLKTAYKFNKIINSIEKELSFYYNKLNEIIEKYSEKDDNGKPLLSEDKTSIQIEKDKLNECQLEMKELSEVDFNIEDIYFSLDELEKIKLTILETRILMPFLKE